MSRNSNLQALDLLADLLASDPDNDMATLAVPITDQEVYLSPNVVKVVCDDHGPGALLLAFTDSDGPRRRTGLRGTTGTVPPASRRLRLPPRVSPPDRGDAAAPAGADREARTAPRPRHRRHRSASVWWRSCIAVWTRRPITRSLFGRIGRASRAGPRNDLGRLWREPVGRAEPGRYSVLER